MGNTGSRVSDNGERTDSDEKLKEDDVKMENDNQDSEPIEDYMMSEVSSLRDNFEEEGNGFHVGDIVWGEEVNSQQWWPCQIYDSSDASDLALKTMQKGKILVAYFGANERSFAWCNPLQLKPFLEKFSEFSKMTQSRGFLCAVEEAVREIGEAVEQFLVCDETALVSNVAVNSGIKEGVLVPSLRREIVSSLVLENPGFDLENIKRLAKMVSVSDLLEIEVLKRNISAFYRCKGRFDLAKYDEDMFILGLEDKEDDESYKRLLRKCSRENMKCGNEVDKVNLGDVVTTTSLRKTRSDVSKSLSPRTRKRKNKTGLGDDGIERREKSNHLEESEKKDNSGETLSLEMGNRNGGETILQNGKRERKRSKYLSPEYVTDFSCRARKGKILESDESSKIQVEKAIKEATSEEMLDLIREVALNKTYAEDNDMVREYVSMYRSFTYHDESNNKIHKDEEKYSGVELVIKTGLGSCALPSKEDLMELYKKFGALDKERSCVLENDSCAHIAFLNVPDGEEAFKKSLEICPFATASTVTFELKYNPSLEKLKDIERREGVMEIECLKEKLEEMRSLIDESHGEITKELKMKLEDGSRNLLERVRKITVRSS